MRQTSVQNEREKTGDRIINFRTLLFCALFLCLGIVFAYLRTTYAISLWWLLLLAPLLAVICTLCFTRSQWRRICVSISLVSVAFALGAILFTVQINDFQSAKEYEGERAVHGRVVMRERDGDSCILTLDDVEIDGEEVEGKIEVYLSIETFEKTSLCDDVLVEGALKTNTNAFGTYGFRANVVDEDIRYTMQTDKFAVMGKDFRLFLWLRDRMETVVYAGMDETPAAVTVATLTGNTSGIDEGLLDNIRRGGIAHIFAVSGLHVGALYAACTWLMEKTGLKQSPKWLRFLIVLAVLLFYGGICGFSASVIRAVVMCSLLYLSKLLGLGDDGLETVSAAAIVALCVSPVTLFTVGFLLSFAACYGIMLFSRPLEKLLYWLGDWVRYTLFRKEKKPFVLEEDTHPLNTWQRIVRAVVSFLSVTFAAQIATTPIQIAAFSYLSVWSLLLNCLFVPLISAIFALMLLFVLVACLLPASWSFVILYVPNVVWSALLLLFEGGSFSAITVANFPVSAMLSYYTAAILCSGRWNVKKSVCTVFFLSFAALFVLCMALANVGV